MPRQGGFGDTQPSVEAQPTWGPNEAEEEVFELIDLDEDLRSQLAPNLPRMRFVLDDLGGLKDEALAERSLEVFAELTLRALVQLRASPDPVEDLKRWLPLFHAMLHDNSGLRRLRAILEYLHHVTDAEQDSVRNVVREIAPAKEDEIMTTLAERLRQEGRDEMTTLAERLRQEGRDEGRQEGRDEGRQEGRDEGRHAATLELVLRLVTLRFGPPDAQTRARLEAADDATLAAWSERLVSASNLAELFAKD